MNVHEGAPASAALLKIFYSWVLFGISAMTPLQAVQLIAGILAIIYTAIQTWVLVRDRILRDKGATPEDTP